MTLFKARYCGGDSSPKGSEPGTYRIIIEARSPYRHMAKDGIVVKEGQPVDIGEISLQKWE